MTLHFVENNDISKFYLVEGKDVDIDDEDGVWLDKRFADAKHLNVGDNISFSVNGLTINKEIKGRGYSPEHVYTPADTSIITDFIKTGYAYLSYKAFPAQIQYNVLLVDFNGNPNDYVADLDSVIGGNYSSFVKQADHQSVSQFNEELDQHKMMGDIFPVVFILIAVLTLLTTMARIINHQRTQIGVLKAVGFYAPLSFVRFLASFGRKYFGINIGAIDYSKIVFRINAGCLYIAWMECWIQY